MSFIKDIATTIEEEIERGTAAGTRLTAAEVSALTGQLYAEAIAASALHTSPASRPPARIETTRRA